MQNNQKLRRCFAGLFTLALVAGVAQADDYKIKFVRPIKVGDEFTDTVVAKVNRTVELTKKGEDPNTQTTKFTAKSTGTLKVLAINEKTGAATKIRFQVDSLTKDGQEYYPQGTVIIAEKSGKQTSFSIDGDRPDPEHFEVLDELLDVSNPDSTISDDETTGTDKPQKVGDTWAIDSDKGAKSLVEDEDLPVEAKDLTGESKLVEVKKQDDVDVMVITTDINIAKIKKDLPDGGAITDGSMKVQITETLPVDVKEKLLSQSMKTTMEMTFSLPDNGGTSKLKVKADKTEDRTPMKK